MAESSSRVGLYVAVVLLLAAIAFAFQTRKQLGEQRKATEEAKTQVQRLRKDLRSVRKINKELDEKLAEAQRIAALFEADLRAEEERRRQLMMDYERKLTDLQGQLEDEKKRSVTAAGATEELTRAESEKAQLRHQLTALRQEKLKLEKELLRRKGTIPGAVDVGEVTVTTGRRLRGKVLVVNRKHDFVVIDIGTEDGLERDTVLILHRSKKYVGKVRVEKVYKAMAAATLMTDWMQEEVQANDGVKRF